MRMRWEGLGINEVGYWEPIYSQSSSCRCDLSKPVVKVDKKYFRPTEVETLVGDPSKARQKLGWQPEITAQEMCLEMIQVDRENAKRNALLRDNGFEINVGIE